MRRRDILRLAAFATCLAGNALAQPGRAYRLGVLSENVTPLVQEILVTELGRFGFVEGRNLVLDIRSGGASTLPDLARGIAAQNPDAVVAIAGQAVVAMRAASATIPIVAYGGDPIMYGIADSTANPGGNVTGISIGSFEIEPKRLQLLAEAVPDRRRIGVLVYSRMTAKERLKDGIEEAGRSLGLDLVIAEASGIDGYAAAFGLFRDKRAEALLITAQAVFFRDTDTLVRLSREAALPTICEWPEMANRGCVLGYGPNRPSLYRRTAAIVAAIFRGMPPSAIPIEQPTELTLNVNLKAAHALGITIPPALLARAEEVIE